jgi:hypothetical protein
MNFWYKLGDNEKGVEQGEEFWTALERLSLYWREDAEDPGDRAAEFGWLGKSPEAPPMDPREAMNLLFGTQYPGDFN